MAASIEQIAEYFVRYLFEEYHGIRHVRRVATWIGFILKAVNRASGGTLQLNRTRQLTFTYKTHRFKARYNHQAAHAAESKSWKFCPAAALQKARSWRKSRI